MRAAVLLVCMIFAGCAGSEVLAPHPVVDAGDDLWGEVDFHCTVDADCRIKNIGNCCGYFPACVHRDSPADPERVRALCESRDLSSICGYPEITACRCVAGRCEADDRSGEILD